MKNITLSADENLIEQARLTAKAQRKTAQAPAQQVEDGRRNRVSRG